MENSKKEIRSITSELDIREFIASHAGEINGLYQDRYYRMGGWNGLMDALGEVEKRYGVEINSIEIMPSEDFEIPINEKIKLFERIIKEELHT
jgi:hypothetical protein